MVERFSDKEEVAGPIPATPTLIRARSLVGRAPHLQCGGREFESPRVHHIELAASLGASPIASAGSFASKSKSLLKLIKSFCWLIWRFEPNFLENFSSWKNFLARRDFGLSWFQLSSF